MNDSSEATGRGSSYGLGTATGRAVGVLIVAIVAGCSSSPAGAGSQAAPASIAIVAGDGQIGAPGVALPVHPAAIVRDASGDPLSGVTVTFGIDSGGGTLAGGSVTTGADGVATAGVWTLGASGANVIVATVATIAPVRFHAQALSATARTIFNATPVGASGGTLTYLSPGDPLNGLSVVVPNGSFAAGTAWTIVADSAITIPAQAGVAQMGPALVIGNGQGYSASVISVTVPMHLAATDVAQAFYYDPASGTLEPIPVVGQTDTSATLATTHFSHDLMALPANGPSATGLRQSIRAGFGNVVIVWAVATPASLTGSYTSGFAPGQDDWEWDNFGDFISPLGDCEGMEIAALYYRYFVSSQGRPTLYHHFDKSLANEFDDVNAVRFVGSVQGDVDAALSQHWSQVRQLINSANNHNVNPPDLAPTHVLLTLKRTHQPVLMALVGDGFQHAVIAYAATATASQVTIMVSDPNLHGIGRPLIYTNGVLQPFSIAGSASDPPSLVTAAFALGVSGEISLTALNQRWSEFLAKTSGSDRYPGSYTFEVFDSLNSAWVPLGDTVRTTINVLRTRVRCPSCPQPIPGADPSDLQHTSVFNDSGTVKLAIEGVDILLDPGTTGYVVNAYATNPRSDAPLRFAFLDSRSITVLYAPFLIAPRNGVTDAGIPFQLAAINGGLMTAGSKFIWTFGDGTAAQTVAGDSTVTHTFAQSGPFTVTVEFRSAAGTLLGRFSTGVVVRQEVAWQIDSIGIAFSGSKPVPLVDSTLHLRLIRDSASIVNTPGLSYILLQLSEPTCPFVLFEQFDGSATPGQGILGAPTAQCGPLFQGTGTLTYGTVGQGTIVGAWSSGAGTVSFADGAINAPMTGMVLRGSFTLLVHYSGGDGRYTFTFHALRATLPSS